MVGCIIGMFPLLLIKEVEDDEVKEKTEQS